MFFSPLVVTVLVVIGIALVVFLWAVGVYNGLVRSKAHVDEGMSGIDVQLKRRYDLIPNLIAVVKQYSIHEKEILEKIATMRAASMGATELAGKADAEAGLTKALKSLFAISENYPDLKANQNFLALQQELSTIETEVQLARRYYNGTARNYNTAVQSFPSNLIAKLGNFSVVSYFELSSASEREVPQVKF